MSGMDATKARTNPAHLADLVRALGYTDEESARLTSAGIYFDKMAAKQKEEW